MALVTRVAMGTLNNRRLINMATVPVGTAKTFRKFIRSVIQVIVCNIAILQYCNPGSQFQFQ